MRPLPAFQLILLVASVLWFGGCAMTRTAPKTPQSAHDRGVRYLIENQNPDGSFGSFKSGRPSNVFLDTVASHDAFGVATSALCTMALIEPSRTDPQALAALDRGIEYLLEEEAVGRATGQTFYGTWSHTFILHLMAKLYQDERFAERHDAIRRVIERELALLDSEQMATGGWGYYDFGHSFVTPTGNIATSFNTASSLIAYHEAKQAGFEVSPRVRDAALLMLRALRKPDGAYSYSFSHLNYPVGRANLIQGSIGRSQACNLGLYLYREAMDDPPVGQDELRMGIEQLRKWHHYILIGKGRPRPHEAWYATAGYYFFYGHYHAGLVLETMNHPDRLDHAKWLQQLMVELQDPGDYWFDFHLYGYHKFYGTAYALMVLQSCERVIAEQTEEGLPTEIQRAQREEE